MYIIDGDKFKRQEIMTNMLDAARERKNMRSPEVKERADRVIDLLVEVKRKGALTNEKKYTQIRMAFEQNYKKLNPNSTL